MSASEAYESIQKANQSGIFINTSFDGSSVTGATWKELDMATKAEVGPEVETKTIKARRMTRSGSTAETVKSSSWKAKVDLIEYKLSDTTDGAVAFRKVKDASRKKPVPGLVHILHVEELDADLSYATQAVCIVKPSPRNENEDDDVNSSYEFVPGVNAVLASEQHGKVTVANGVPGTFTADA